MSGSRYTFRPFLRPVHSGEDAAVRVRPVDELERVYREEADRLWRALWALTGDPELASDAASEAFEQCLRRGEAVRSPARWIWRAAFKIALGELKAMRDRAAVESSLIDRPVVAPEAAERLREALTQLPRKQRAAVVLHYYVGFSTREISGILGSTSATVRVQLSQG